MSRYTCLASLCRVPCDWWILFASRPRNRIFLCQLYAYYASCIYAVCWKYYQQRRPIKRSRPDRRNITPFGFTSTREGNTTFSRAKLESFDSSVRIRESNWIETSPRRHARNWFNYRCSCNRPPYVIEIIEIVVGGLFQNCCEPRFFQLGFRGIGGKYLQRYFRKRYCEVIFPTRSFFFRVNIKYLRGWIVAILIAFS